MKKRSYLPLNLLWPLLASDSYWTLGSKTLVLFLVGRGGGMYTDFGRIWRAPRNHPERGTSPPRPCLSSALPLLFCTHTPCMWEWLGCSLKPSVLRFIDFLLPPPRAKSSISASVSLWMVTFHLLAWCPTFQRYSRFQRPNGHYRRAFIKLVVCGFTRAYGFQAIL